MKLFIAAVFLQVLLFVGVIGQKEHLLRTGTVIRMKLAPKDPRSLLQGDYVVLRYATLQRRALGKDSILRVVLALDPKDGFHKFARRYQDGEELKDGEVLLRGRRDYRGRPQFGIESFFVPVGTGGEVERTMKAARMRVSKSGDALVEALE